MKFLRGLKPNIARLVQDAAHDEWWTSSEQSFAKALTFQTNKAAMIGSFQPPPLNTEMHDSEPRKSEAAPANPAKSQI